jgi:predicted Zn-dependent protease
LNPNLLGVSRDCEFEDDQPDLQYAWNTGYDPSGFILFFDKVATRERHVNGASWFRTHPPFYQRMVDTRDEIITYKRGQPFEERCAASPPTVKGVDKQKSGLR